MWKIEQLEFPFCKAKNSVVYYWTSFVENLKAPFKVLSERISVFLGSSAPYYLALDHINANGKTLRFMEPITASVAYLDNTYFCQNDDLGIISTSFNLEDCIKDFHDEVLFIWNEYGREEDNKLTNGAKELKRKILQYINK